MFTPDSSAFLVTINDIVFGRRVGDDCAQCQARNGTTGTKPAFVLASGGSSPLPANVLSGALVGASVTYSITNNLSFDPLRVRPVTDPVQGYMLVIVRSGSVVLGSDSLNGATATFAPGATISRPIPINTGTVVGQMQVDVTINSPAGDPAQPGVFINANGSVNTTAVISDVRMSNVRINVVNKNITNQPDTIDLAGLNESITNRIVSGRLEMTIDNPWTVAGDIGVDLVYNPPSSVPKTIALPPATQPQAPQVRDIIFDNTEMKTLLGNEVIINMSGPVSSATPVTVSPKQAITIASRMVLVIRTGGGQ
jgi:hypothetical protein